MTAPTLLLNGEAIPASSYDGSEDDFDSDDEYKQQNIAFAWVWRRRRSRIGAWRHTMGIICLLITVILWTASNFLASTMFADNTYSKPYLITYINTGFFILPLIPISMYNLYRDPTCIHKLRTIFASHNNYNALPPHDNGSISSASADFHALPLSLAHTTRLALSFCILWFAANYFVSACLLHTTVSTSTILTSTSSIWTLFFAAVLHAERFTVRKLLAVVACLVGVALTAGVDLSGESNAHRGKFPSKSAGEMALGNVMALFSAVLYGLYAVLMKKRIGDERKVNLVVFFGLVGLWNVVLLWPGLFVLHWTGIERWQAPPSGRVTGIIIMNAAVSLVSDVCWGLAMLFTSPLLVTIGLSLTIPLSLVGQLFLNSQSSSLLYWLGALVVLFSFVFINHEEGRETGAGGGVVEPLIAGQVDRERDMSEDDRLSQ